MLFPSPMHESESEVAQSCPTLRDPLDCSLPGSSILHGSFQARVLEWVAIALSDICTTLYKIDNKDLLYSIGGFSNGSAVKNLPEMQETQEMRV